VTKRLGLFIAGAVAIWATTVAPASVLWPDAWDSTLTCSLAAMGLCLFPTVLTFLWSSWGLKRTPDQQLLAVLGGTGVRMFFVLGLGLLLTTTVAYLREHRIVFWLWVLGYYLATLALEMVLLVRAQTGMEKTEPAASPAPVSK
jgi:hypothetical protein